jgi:hypothetical protein
MDQSAKQELSDLEAAALHAWLKRFNHRSGGRGLGLEPWYIDGYIPRDATADARDELTAAVVAVLCADILGRVRPLRGRRARIRPLLSASREHALVRRSVR